jgi:hypothetical protein
MKIKLLDGLKKVLAGFKCSTPDIEVASALTKFCKTYGADVVVERHAHNSVNLKGKRNFLIIFESNNEAVQFADEASLMTHGYEGVMVEVA